MNSEQDEDVLTLLKSHVPDPRKPLADIRKDYSEFYEGHQDDEHPHVERVMVSETLPAYWVRVAESRPDGAILFFHGGGFTTGSTKDHLGICAKLARAACTPVLSVDYRLAPESVFPAPVDDAVRAYRFLTDKKVPPHRVVPVGISAGGNLVLSLLVSARDQRLALPPAAVCMSPVVDMLFTGTSVTTNQGLDWLTPAHFDAIRMSYLAGHDPKDPLASPVHARLAGLPRLYVQAGTHELLLSGIANFVDRARWAGTPVMLELWEGMFHSWQVFAAEVPEGKRAIDHAGAFIQDTLGRGNG